jgi:hypothetical protein
MKSGWAQQRGDDALRRALHQFRRERAADAIAEEKEAQISAMPAPDQIAYATPIGIRVST